MPIDLTKEGLPVVPRGEDGWRWACIIWKSGNAYQSRTLHYFKDGHSFCGAHYDAGKPWVSGIFPPAYSAMRPARCKKCQKKLDKINRSKETKNDM